MSKHDTMTLQEAAHFAGRKPGTIRAWIRSGKLRARRRAKKGNAPLLIDKGALLQTMRDMGIIEAGAGGVNEGINRGVGRHVKQHVKSHVDGTSKDDTLTALLAEKDARLAELQADKARLTARVDRLEDRLAELEKAYEGALEKNAELWRENQALGGTGRGIKGYLRDGAKVLKGLVSR